MQGDDVSTHARTSFSDRFASEESQLPPIILEKIPQVKVKQKQLTAISNKFALGIHAKIEHSIQSLEYLTEGCFLALGCGDGTLRIMSTSKGDIQYQMKGQDFSPITGIALNPNKTAMRNAVMITHSGGMLEYWHTTSKQLLFSRHYDQMLQTCEISPSGLNYAFAGDQGKVRMGHLSKGEVMEVETGHLGNHDNRIFCLKWNPFDQNLLLSGGWDKAVHFWDIRTRTSVNKLFGFYMGGDAIDFSGNDILLGNNKPDFPLRIYDCNAGKMRSIDWPLTNTQQIKYITGVQSCSFAAADGSQIVAGSPRRQLRFFKNQACMSEWRHQNDEAKMFSMICNKQQRKVATGWNNGQVMIFQY